MKVGISKDSSNGSQVAPVAVPVVQPSLDPSLNAQLGTVQGSTQVASNIPPQPVLPNESVKPQNPPAREVVNTNSPREPRERQDHDVRDRRDPNEEVPDIDFPPFRSNKQGSASKNDTQHSQLYVIIARTKIMEEPSYWAGNLGDLYEGDKVAVDDNLGKWLKIHTRKGRVGYILAQDATKY